MVGCGVRSECHEYLFLAMFIWQWVCGSFLVSRCALFLFDLVAVYARCGVESKQLFRTRWGVVIRFRCKSLWVYTTKGRVVTRHHAQA
jgi:hypothetical protein